MVSKAILSFRRVLSEELVSSASISLSCIDFLFEDEGGEIREIIASEDNGDENSISIPGPHSEWSPDEHPIIIRGECYIKNPKVFFGEGGIAKPSSVLGVSLIVTSPDSSQRCAIPFSGSVVDSEDPISLKLDSVLDRGTYRGRISLETVLYLKRSVTGTKDSTYASESGFIFGTISEKPFFIFLDESSLEFPIREGKFNEKSLWHLDCNWDDPRQDRFDSNNVALYFNTKHPEYPNLHLHEENKNMLLMAEIISSAISQIILKIKYEGGGDMEYWRDTVSGNLDTLKEGSISSIIFYMLDSFDWPYENVTALCKAIRSDVYQRMCK